MTTAFCTYVSDKYYLSMGADKLVNSAKFFHPDIPFFVYKDGEINDTGVEFGLMHPLIMCLLIDRYERVIYFDADSIISGSLDELLSATDYDVVCVRNNNDYNMAGMDEPITEGKEPHKYLNAGLVATTSKRFLNEWKEKNLSDGAVLPFMEQSVLNSIIGDFGDFNYLIIDGNGTNVYYGVSAQSGIKSHWDSWKEITIDEFGNLILNDKKVKVLHHGGGFNPNKLDLNMFNEQTKLRLLTITENR